MIQSARTDSNMSFVTPTCTANGSSRRIFRKRSYEFLSLVPFQYVYGHDFKEEIPQGCTGVRSRTVWQIFVAHMLHARVYQIAFSMATTDYSLQLSSGISLSVWRVFFGPLPRMVRIHKALEAHRILLISERNH